MDRNELRELAFRAKSGDRQAFEALYNEYMGKVFSFAKRNVGDSDAARDITSETFTAALENISSLRDEESFTGWLYSIAYKKCADCLRVRYQAESVSEDDLLEIAAADPTLNGTVMLPDDHAVNAETKQKLGEIINSLPNDQRSAVMLYYYEEMSVSEVARALGTSENNTRQKLYKARKKLRKGIEKVFGKDTLLAAVPVEALLRSTEDAGHLRKSAGAARVSGFGTGIRIAAVGVFAAAAVAVPMRISGSGGDHRPEEIGKFISTEALQADVDKALSKEYEGFTIAEGLKIDLPEEYIKCDFTQTDGFQANADVLAKRFFTEYDLAAQTLTEQTDKIAGSTVLLKGFRDERKMLHCSVWDNGFCCLMNPDSFTSFGKANTFYKLYHVDRGDDLSDVYQLPNGKVSVAEAVNTAQKWVDKNYADLEPDYSFRVKTVIVRRDHYGQEYFKIRIAKCYRGIYLDELCEVTENQETEPNGNWRTVSSLNYIEAEIKTAGGISYFSNCIGTLIPKEKGRLERIYPLSDALDDISRISNVSDSFKISDIKLKYMLSPEYDFKSNKLYYTAGTEMKGRIVWEFVIDVPQEIGSLNNDVRKYICVDVETGEMSYQFNLNMLNQ